MTVIGSVNHTLWRPVGGNSSQFATTFADMFVSLYRFLNSARAQSIGIFRRACNFNNGSSDCDYAIRTPGIKPGDNAWAVFEFTNANQPFWILIQQSDSLTNANFGTGTGAPGGVDYSRRMSACAVSFAVREDGGSPWNGTTLNNGSDTKGSQVWTPGASRLSMFPINNGSRGTFRTAREGMHPLCLWLESDSSARTRLTMFHCIATEDSLTVIVGMCGGLQNMVTYMGSYNPISNDPSCNYCFFSNQIVRLDNSNNNSFDVFWPYSAGGGDFSAHPWIGSNLAGGTYTSSNSPSGNVDYWSGGIIDKRSFTSVPIGLAHQLWAMFYIEYTRRLASNPALNKSDVYALPLYVDGLNRGAVGELTNLMTAYMIPQFTTLRNRQYAVFGRVMNEGKVVVRWGGNVMPGRVGNVLGEQF